MFLRLLSFFALALLITACGIPASDPTTAMGKRAILDDVNVYLSAGDCSNALIEAQPLYNSSNTDNDVRTAMASVYGCNAGLDVFTLINTISSSTAGTGYPYTMFAQAFPSHGSLSNPTDKVVESAGLGMQAVMSVLNPGEVLVSSDLFNTSTYNPGSELVSDRTSDANIYTIFLTMAIMGGLENRYGANASGHPTHTLPATPFPSAWNAGATIDANGCAYASALLNFSDGLNAEINTIGGSVQAALQSISSSGLTTAALDTACKAGCTACTAAGGTASCTQCPLSLRNPDAVCAGSNNDVTSCAAAGIVDVFVNNPLGPGWQ